jgi:hypothetical protein
MMNLQVQKLLFIADASCVTAIIDNTDDSCFATVRVIWVMVYDVKNLHVV